MTEVLAFADGWAAEGLWSGHPARPVEHPFVFLARQGEEAGWLRCSHVHCCVLLLLEVLAALTPPTLQVAFQQIEDLRRRPRA